MKGNDKMSKGIDVSVWQGVINWDIIKQSNLDTTIIRCAYGGEQDSTSDYNFKQANIRDLTVGAYAFATYHYSENSNENNALENAKNEANKVVEILKKYVINSYVALDYEFEKYKSTVLSKETLTECANIYMDILQANGYTPLLYTSVSTLYQYFNIENLKYDFWLAYYNDEGFNSDNFPEGRYGDMMRNIQSKIKMWQYSSSENGAKYGMSSERLDVNHVYGNCRFNDVGTKTQDIPTSQPITPQPVPTPVPKPSVIYQAFSDDRWLPEVVNYNEVNSDGYAGIFGKTISGIRIRLSNGHVIYIQSHINGYKMNDWLGMVSKWDNTSDGYSGWKGKPIDCVAVKADNVKLKYRVHTLGGQWLAWVNTFNIADAINGFAGIYGKAIDAIQIGVE